ncbi:MAG: cytochrome c [Actinobacteria bacterium]|nr:cytochrome c [Actinomycetota bacterium]
MNRQQKSIQQRTAHGLVGSLILLLTLIAALLGLAGRVDAAAEIEVDAPSESTVGEVVQISATVTDGGTPVADAVVTVSRQAEIGGKSGFVELDSGTTDEAGVVQLEFVQYAAPSDAEALQVELQGPKGVDAATKFEMKVIDGPQQVTASSGADVGIINKYWLIAVLCLVWFFVIAATVQLLVISRASDGSTHSNRLIPYFMVGFVLFTGLGMFYVVLTQPTMHANLAPNEAFDRVPTAYVGEIYPYQGLGGDPADRPDDLTGEVLYVQAGCVSCHGINANGSMGGELDNDVLDDTEEFTEAVREGPDDMPAFADNLLTQAEIDRIIEFLHETRTSDAP